MDQKITGNIRGTKDVTSSEKCQTECQTTGYCVYFHLNLTTMKCDLLDSATDTIGSLGFVSGPKFCDDCLEYGHDLGAPSSQTTAISVGDCRGHCQADEACQFYSFAEVTGICKLAADDSSKGPVTSNLIGVGKKHCDISDDLASDCFEPGVRLNSGYLWTHTKIYSLEECQGRCLDHYECFYFIWRKSTNECQKFRHDKDRVQEAGWITGARVCQSACTQTGIAITDATSTTETNIYFIQECRKMCQYSTSCNSYTFDTTAKTCQLNTADISVTVANPNKVSAPKFCGIPASCIQTNMQFTHDESRWRFDFYRFEDCRLYCLMSGVDDCAFYSWRLNGDNSCSLRRNNNTIQSGDRLVGEKNC